MTEPTDEPKDSEEELEAKKLSDAFLVRKGSLFNFYAPPILPIAKIISDSLVPNLSTQLSGLMPQMDVFTQWMAELFRVEFKSPFEEMTENLNRIVRAQWEPIFESLRNIARQIYPENWEDVPPPSLDVLESILIDEGIPLIWVPGPPVVEALFKADSASDRRRIVGRRWRGIVSDCEAVLEGVRHPSLSDACDFGIDCIRALRAGHTSAAQALTGNLLDTLLHTYLSKETRVALTKNDLRLNGAKFNLDDYQLRVAFTFAPVWCAHAKYFPKSGDSIPRTYGRHPTIHAVSRTQYTRINAVIGLMLATSVIKFFDVELARRGDQEA